MVSIIEQNTINKDLAENIRILYTTGKINDTQLKIIYEAYLSRNNLFEEGDTFSIAIKNYKTKLYRRFNSVLRNKTDEDMIEKSGLSAAKFYGQTKSQIKYLSDYLKSFNCDAGVQLYRTDSYEILDDVTVESGEFQGKSLSSILQDAEAGKIDIETVTNIFTQQPISQEGFLSTSLLEIGANECDRTDRKILWHFTTEKDTHGAYIDVHTENFGNEYEFLIDKGAKINITSINYVDNRWCIEASVSN